MVTYGIDANVLTREKRTGTERYVFELLMHLKKLPLRDDERIVLYSSAPLDDLGALPERWEVKVFPWTLPFKGWTHLRLSYELLRNAPDVFFTPAHELPMFCGAKTVLSTVHDVAFRRLSDVYPQSGTRRQEWAISRAIRHSDHLFTVSKATKLDLAELYDVRLEKMTVTPLAVDKKQFVRNETEVARVKQKYDLLGPYILSVGRIEKKKNIVTLIDAFDQFRGAGGKAKLVLGGSFGFGGDDIKQKIDNSHASADIIVLGYIDDADIAPLMAGADAYVFPTHYEGFGMPALEAMAVGTPVVLSDIPALREVAEDAALYASPTDASSWSLQMLKVTAENEKRAREDRIEKGFERVHSFDWNRTAEKTLEVLRRVWKTSSRN